MWRMKPTRPSARISFARHTPRGLKVFVRMLVYERRFEPNSKRGRLYLCYRFYWFGPYKIERKVS